MSDKLNENKNAEASIDDKKTFMSSILPDSLSVPEISKSLAELYKVGSLPLAILLIVAIALFIFLVSTGFLKFADQIFNFITFLAASGVVVHLALSWLAFLKWRDNLRANEETYKLRVNTYRELIDAEKQLQDKFLLNIMNYAGTVASRDGLTESRIAEIKGVTEVVGNLAKEMLKIRADYQPKIPEKIQDQTSKEASDGAIQ
jgi:hypothetical protein